MRLCLALLFLLPVAAVAQTTFSNLDDTLSGWQNPPCSNLNPVGSSCAGGTGNPQSDGTFSTTITQAVTSTGSHTVTVASTAGMVPQQAPLVGGANSESILITAVGVGTITATFNATHLTGVTLTCCYTIQTINNPTPSLDGESMKIGFTGPTLSSGQTTNVLWPHKVGANSTVTNLSGTWNLNFPNASKVQAKELDIFQFVGGQRFMYGTECDNPSFTSGKLRIWNQCANSNGGAWVTTTVSCPLFSSSNVWHSFVLNTHRVVGDTSCTGGNPCMYYDSIIIDGVNVTPGGGFTPQCSAPNSEPDNIGTQTQIDEASAGGLVTEFEDEMSLTTSSGSNFISQSGGSASCGADGTQTTESVATFNSNAQVAGTVYKLCGAITTAVAFNASGSSGNLITLQWETGASVQVCSTSGAVRVGTNHFLLIDLGGVTNAITCPNNGDGLSTQTDNIFGVYDGGAGGLHDVEIRNGTIGPLYQHLTSGSTTGSGVYGVYISGGGNVLLHNLTLTHAAKGIEFDLYNTATGNQIYSNTLTNVGSGFYYACGSATSCVDTAGIIHDNNYTVGANWLNSGVHQEMLHVYAQTGGSTSISGLLVYNNYCHGAWPAGAGTACFEVSQAGSGTTQGSQSGTFFNNVCQLTGGTTAPGDGCYYVQNNNNTWGFYNNVADCVSNTQGIGFQLDTQTGNVFTMKNNIVLNCLTQVYDQATTGTGTNTLNDNIYYGGAIGSGSTGWYRKSTEYCSTSTGSCGPGATGTLTLTTWQASSGSPDAASSTANPGLNPNYTVISSGSLAFHFGVTPSSPPAAYFTGAPLTPGNPTTCGAGGCVARAGSGPQDAGSFPFAGSSTNTITVTAPLNGFVTDNQNQVYCPSTNNTLSCVGTYTTGSVVTLTATSTTASTFTGWTGACSGISTCVLTVNSNLAVAAVFTANVAALPQNWVNNLEYLSAPTSTISFPTLWSCHGTAYPTGGGNYANTQAGLQQAVNDAETCRTAHLTDSFLISIPAGSSLSGNAGIALPQTAGDTSTSFITLNSATPLPLGQTVCSHGIQDNLASSAQPGIRNLGCAGASLSYQLGTSINTISPGAFTLANGVVTNTSNYDDLALMYTITCTLINCDAISTAAQDVNGISPHHFAILNAELTLASSLGCCAPVKIGQGSETAISQLPDHIHFAYDYVHGDWGDAPMSGCPSACIATGPAVGTTSIPADFNLAGCIYCSIMYTYTDQSLRPASEGHAVLMELAQQIKLGHNVFEGMSSGAFTGGFSNAVSIPNFVSGTDVEDRANRYTYPYSWMLAAGAPVLAAVTKDTSNLGSGYTNGDVLTLVQGGASGGTFTITASGGQITGGAITTLGNGYVKADHVPTTGGTGTGGDLDIKNTGYLPAGGTYERKNCHELKSAYGYLFDGNICENVDYTGAQGLLLSVKSDNTSGGATGNNYWITAQNVTVTNLVGRNSCNGVTLGSRSELGGGFGGGTALPSQIFNYSNNLLYQISVNTPGCLGASTSGPQYGFRLGGASILNTWSATAVRDANGQTSTLTLTTQAGGTQSNTAVGDPVTVGTCSDTTFNTTFTAQGVPALPGTSPTTLTVVYPNPGTANATTTGCTFYQYQGWADDIFFAHNSDFINAGTTSPTDPYNSNPGSTNPLPLLRNINIANSVFVGGGFTSTYGEGTRTTTQTTDPLTLGFNNTLMPGRSVASCPGHTGSACYTEYGGANAGASPPVTVYLTLNPFCTTTSPSGCAGILAGMSQSSFPATISDWTTLRLCHVSDAACGNTPSTYAAGQSGAGSDGLDLGFNPTPALAAEVLTQYHCGGACGSGPYPDTPIQPPVANGLTIQFGILPQ